MIDLPIAIVAPMREELRALERRLRPVRRGGGGPGREGLLRGTRSMLHTVGEGAERSARRLQRLLDAEPVRALVAVGVAGAVSSDLSPGDVCVGARVRDGAATHEPDPGWFERAASVAGVRPATLIAVPRLVATAQDKAALVDGGTATADLESGAIARVAQERGVPWVILRAVSDTAAEGLPRFLTACQREDGSIDRWKLLRAAALRPRRWRALRGAARRIRLCSDRLADTVEALLSAS